MRISLGTALVLGPRTILGTLAVFVALANGCARGPHFQKGAAAIGKYGCGSCHTIGSIPDARGLTGPPLTGIGARRYVAGKLSNNAGNMARWIQDPQGISPGTAMPNLGVTAADAQAIATFLEEQ